MDSECSRPQQEKEGNNIIEIYDFPAALETKDLLSIFSEYRNAGFFIKWVNDTHALGVFSGPAEAVQALSKEHPQCKVGPISRACKSCKQKASQVQGVGNRGRGRGRSRGRGRPNRNRDDKRSSDDSTGIYPLHVLLSDDENDEGAQKKFHLPVYEAEDPGATEYGSVQIPSISGYGQDKDISMKSKEPLRLGKGKLFDRRKTNDCDDTGLQSHYKSRRPRTTTANACEREDLSLEASIERSPRIRKIGYRKLKEWTESVKDPDILLLEILTPKSGFPDILNEKLPPQHMRFVLEILVQSFKSRKKQTVLELVHLLTTKNFLLINFSVFIVEIDIGVAKFETQELGSLLKNICSLTCIFLQYMQSHLSALNILIDAVERLSTKNEKCKEVIQSICPDVMKIVDEMKEARDCIQTKRAHADEKLQSEELCESMQPPEDFRSLDILPALKDIYFNEKPFLRVNKVKGSYEDLNHYLDIQFRLLREDYLHPLRQGIMSYRKNLEFGKRFQKLQDIRIYENVQLLRPLCSEKGILHNLQFDTSKLQNVNWQSSQRLMYGSLLCLTKDGFQSIFFATVTNRDIKALDNGQVEVKFQDLKAIANFNTVDVFVMAETTAYFEAYKYVLKGLQEIEGNMPFQRYIVHCQPSTKPPKYLLQFGTVLSYDFSPIMFPKSENRYEVPVLNTSKWPSAEKLQVDESQYRALQMALTKEMAIIQGPPGTGKTFVGLKIVQLLLHNKDVWTTKKSMDPILVVCYTNHALDQFLSEISQYSKKLVRVGGRCSKEELLKYTLQKYREDARADKTVSQIVHDRKYDCKAKMEESRKKIENASQKIKAAKVGILKLEELRPFISDNHMDALHLPGSKNRLDEWLGFSQEEDFYDDCKVDEIETEKAEIMDRWVKELLSGESIPVMCVEKLKEVQFFWKLSLYERASFYKLLHDQFQKANRDMLDQKTRNFNDILHKPCNEELEKLKREIYEIANQLHKCERCIIEVDIMKKYLPKKIRKLVIRLQNQMSDHSEFLEWMCLDGSLSSIEKILACLEGQSEEIEEFFENEERHIDEEDYIDFEIAATKREKADVQLSTLSSASLSILSDPNIPVGQQRQQEWSMQISKVKLRKALKGTLNGEAMSEADSNTVKDIWTLSNDERRKLYRFWLNSYISMQNKSTEEEIKTYSDLCSSFNEVLETENIEIMTGADIIGMTTTGAAKNRDILQTIKPKIIVVEEAAEVLESHIVTSMNPDCQHLILIGDHKQLRPTPTVYMLAKRYNLDISLFERMVNNKLNYTTLGVQHRMRPEISVLMKHIYPKLNDHPCVETYENIQGIDSNVFFINHQQLEIPHLETKSHSNTHEATFVGRLCKYILQQKYEPQQITILTPYTGQVLALKRKMPKSEFQGVKITSVDNFQGEENDIIILSLVRSNKDQSTGFLKIDNRICVALSRARKGLYVIGNLDMLKSQSTLWQNIIDSMKKQNKFGPILTLRCQNHPLKATNVSSDIDFDAMPNGGCKEICNFKLPCGHKCEEFCHVLDSSHELYQCMKQCEKYCSFGHRCSKKCFQPCKECQTLVTKANPSCGHENELPCFEDILKWKCPHQCNCHLPCEHQCEYACYQCKENGSHLKCQQQCSRTLPCGHSVTAKCFQSIENIVCMARCNEKLNCGHVCSGTCNACCQGRLHISCQNKCEKQLICGHQCDQFCRNGCPPCEKNCLAGCFHQFCKRKCYEICEKCTCACQRKCIHQECTGECSEICQNSSCSENCSEGLKCNHGCSGLCNEPCPTFCKVCNMDKLASNSKLALKAMQVIKLYGCGHEFELKTLDRYIVYNHMSSCSLPISTVVCPECFQDINQNARYMDIVKWSRRRIDKIKKAIQEDYQGLVEKKTKILDALKSFRDVDQENVKEITALIERKPCQPQNICLAELQLAILRLLYCLVKHMRDSILNNTKEERSIGEQLLEIREFAVHMSVQKNSQENQTYQKEIRDCYSSQEIEDIKRELLRLTYQINFLLFYNRNETMKEMLNRSFGDLIVSFQEKKKISEKDLHKLKSLASRFKWNMYDKNFEEIDTLFKKMEKKLSVWRYGTWLRCGKGHIFQNDEKGKCPSCGADATMDLHEQNKPSVPVPLNTYMIADDVHHQEEDPPRLRTETKDKMQIRKPTEEQKSSASSQISDFDVSSEHTVNISSFKEVFEENETPVPVKYEKEAQENNSPQTPVDQIDQSSLIKYCDTGHILMRNESICRWCNVEKKQVIERDYVTMAKPIGNNAVLLENTSTDINEEVDDKPVTKKDDTEVRSHHTSLDVNEQADDLLTNKEDKTEVDGDNNQQPSGRKTIQSPTLKYCNAGHLLMKNEDICRQCSEIDDDLTEVHSVL